MKADDFSILHKQLATYLADIHTGWSIGSFGAIAEFHQRSSDRLDIDDAQGLVRVSEKGAIALDADRLKDIQPVAYETVSPRPNRWAHGIVLCMEKNQGRSNERSVLTELGPDSDAPRASDRNSILFDMGLGLQNTDFCIRSDDPKLIESLRAHEGQSLFNPACSAMADILHAHPHRVAMSRFGRVEVYQKIGGPDTGGVSPDGPHTHVLPKLLRTGRTHSANVPVPDDLIPVASIHPASPIYDELAKDIPFDIERYESFQNMLELYGVNEYVMEKQRVFNAATMVSDPNAFQPANTRLARTALRISLR